MKTLKERFWAKVQKTDGCWLWTGTKTKCGYGLIKLGGRRIYAHRVSYELHNGPIPEGVCVLHKCDTPLCVNPGHLFLGTRANNMEDKMAKGRGARGESVGGSKLTDAQVLDIRSRRGQNQRALGREFGVDQSHVSRICSGKFWRHLPCHAQ